MDQKSILGGILAILAAISDGFGPSWGDLGQFWSHLGWSWGRLGSSWGRLGASWGRLGRILEASWRGFGRSRGHLERDFGLR